jgi:hypothetical protein
MSERGRAPIDSHVIGTNYDGTTATTTPQRA